MTPATDHVQPTQAPAGRIRMGALAERGEHAMTPNKSPTSRTQSRPRAWRFHLTLLLARPSPPLGLGIVVAAVVIVIRGRIVKLLGRSAPHMTFGAVFLLGVLVVSAGWGIGLAVMTTLVSAAVYLEMHLSTAGGLYRQGCRTSRAYRLRAHRAVGQRPGGSGPSARSRGQPRSTIRSANWRSDKRPCGGWRRWLPKVFRRPA